MHLQLKDGAITFRKSWQEPAGIIHKQHSTMTYRVTDCRRLSEVEGKGLMYFVYIFQLKPEKLVTKLATAGS